MDPNKLSMAKGFFVYRAIEEDAFILERIDARWPTIVNSFSAKEPQPSIRYPLPAQLPQTDILLGLFSKAQELRDGENVGIGFASSRMRSRTA